MRFFQVASLSLAIGCVLLSGPELAAAQSKDSFPRLTVLTVQKAGDLLQPGIELDGGAPAVGLVLRPDIKELPEEGDFVLRVPRSRQAKVGYGGRWLDTDTMPIGSDELIHVSRATLVAALESGGLQVRREPLVASAASWTGLRLFLLEPAEELHLGANMRALFREELTSLAAGSGSSDPRKLAVLPQHPNETLFDVRSYDLFLRPDLATAGGSITSAALTMHAVATGNLSVVPMDFDPNTPAAPQLVISGVDSGPGTPPLAWTPDGTNLRILVTLPTPVTSGQAFAIRVFYSGTPTASFTGQLARAYTRSTHGSSSKPVVYTASQPYGARRWFPSKDRPDDKATTTTMRICVPTGQSYEVVANGLLARIDAGPFPGTETWVWENSYPIPTYLLSFYATDYVYTPEAVYTALDGMTTMGIRHAIYSENVGSEGNGHLGTLQVMNFMATKFGEYPFLREKYWTASWNITFGIEHQTATGMPAASVGSGVSGSVGNGLTRRNIHELAHMWYGDKVTYSSFDHAWLGEAFATYAEALWEENVGGFPALKNYVSNNFSASRTTVNTLVPMVGPDSDSYTGGVIYRRGAWVLHMLRRELGDALFFQTLKDWTSPPGMPAADTYRSADSAAFEARAELTSGRDLTTFFQQWLYRPNADGAVYPDFRFTPMRRWNGAAWEVELGVEQLQSGPVPFVAPIDVRIALADGSTTDVVISTSAKALTSATVVLGAEAPLRADFDPDDWLLNTLVPSVSSVGLPSFRRNAPSYATTVVGASVAGTGTAATFTMSAISLPPFLSFNSGTRVLTATSTDVTPGIYKVVLQFSSTTPVQSRTLIFDLEVLPPATLPPLPPVVINEMLIDNYSDATDAGEYFEILNTTNTLVDLSDWELLLLDGSGAGSTYLTVPFPAGTQLAPFGRTVIGTTATINAVYPGVVNGLGASLDNVVRQSVPCAAVLRSADGRRADSVRWRSDAIFAGPDAALVASASGVGRPLSRTLGVTGRQVVLGRWPDGHDSGNNLLDFRPMPPTPGAANSLPVTPLSLPLIESFNTLPDRWKGLFTDPRVVDPLGAGKPGKASPAIGNVLEVFDASGGGDGAILPTSLPVLHLTGYLWIPQDVAAAPWSTGLGLTAGHDSAWFSNSAGFGLEHGFYLEYQNGSVPMKGGNLPGHAGSVVLWAVNGAPSVGTAPTNTTVTNLGSFTIPSIQRDNWAPFELGVNVPGNRLRGVVNGSVIYDGPVPSGSWPASWNVVVGFRENHTGAPSTANREGTWVDGLSLGTVVPVSLTQYAVE